jgi:hypothetical protein
MEHEFERFVIETGVPLATAAEGCTHVQAGMSRWSDRPSSSSSRTGRQSPRYRRSRDPIGRQR